MSQRLDPAEIESALTRVLLKHGFASARAELCARLFIETTLDGVYSHGLNRFPGFIDAVRRGMRPFRLLHSGHCRHAQAQAGQHRDDDDATKTSGHHKPPPNGSWTTIRRQLSTKIATCRQGRTLDLPGLLSVLTTGRDLQG